MSENILDQAFSSEEKIVAVARLIVRLSDRVHDSLRKLSPDSQRNGLITSYALLTEEYALRSRANILLTEAKRFVIPDFEINQEEVVTALLEIEEKLINVTNLLALSDILSDLTLFSNSISSKKKAVILFLYRNLASLNN